MRLQSELKRAFYNHCGLSLRFVFCLNKFDELFKWRYNLHYDFPLIEIVLLF